jgi:Domain of unknown function (DUF4282)
MELRDLLFFDKMVVPKIITFLYWLILIGVVIGGVVTMFATNLLAGLFGIIVGAFFARVWCELLVVMFKINEALQIIKDK